MGKLYEKKTFLSKKVNIISGNVYDNNMEKKKMITCPPLFTNVRSRIQAHSAVNPYPGKKPCPFIWFRGALIGS